MITDYPPLTLRPVTLAEARRFVGEHHRHNVPPVTWRFGVGIEANGELVGVAMAGIPKARMLMDGKTLEVNRTCTAGTPNANSMLYGAIARAAKSLGYHRLLTYTLAEESGASLRAAGWTLDKHIDAGKSWEEARGTGIQTDIFGTERVPIGPKLRWVKWLVAPEQFDGSEGA